MELGSNPIGHHNVLQDYKSEVTRIHFFCGHLFCLLYVSVGVGCLHLLTLGCALPCSLPFIHSMCVFVHAFLKLCFPWALPFIHSMCVFVCAFLKLCFLGPCFSSNVHVCVCFPQVVAFCPFYVCVCTCFSQTHLSMLFKYFVQACTNK